MCIFLWGNSMAMCIVWCVSYYRSSNRRVHLYLPIDGTWNDIFFWTFLSLCMETAPFWLCSSWWDIYRDWARSWREKTRILTSDNRAANDGIMMIPSIDGQGSGPVPLGSRSVVTPDRYEDRIPMGKRSRGHRWESQCWQCWKQTWSRCSYPFYIWTSWSYKHPWQTKKPVDICLWREKTHPRPVLTGSYIPRRTGS